MSLSRRGFLAQVGTGYVAPLLLGISNKSGSKKPIIGSGDHTYGSRMTGANLPLTFNTAILTAYVKTHRATSPSITRSIPPAKRLTVWWCLIAGEDSSRVGARIFAVERTAFIFERKVGLSSFTFVTFNAVLL
jgi:hypothetical protein